MHGLPFVSLYVHNCISLNIVCSVICNVLLIIHMFYAMVLLFQGNVHVSSKKDFRLKSKGHPAPLLRGCHCACVWVLHRDSCAHRHKHGPGSHKWSCSLVPLHAVACSEPSHVHNPIYGAILSGFLVFVVTWSPVPVLG